MYLVYSYLFLKVRGNINTLLEVSYFWKQGINVDFLRGPGPIGGRILLIAWVREQRKAN